MRGASSECRVMHTYGMDADATRPPPPRMRQVLAALVAQNQDGLTCLMKACRTGNIGVVVYLLNLFIRQLTALCGADGVTVILTSPQGRRSRRSGSRESLLAKCVVDGNCTVAGICSAYFAVLVNKDGETAASLLINFFLTDTAVFADFVVAATASLDNMYLLDLLPLHTIVPRFDNPSTVLNAFKRPFFRNLCTQRGLHADVKLVHVLVSLAATLEVVAKEHPLETDVAHLRTSVEEALRQCMNSDSMDLPANVTKVLAPPADQVGTSTTDLPLPTSVQHEFRRCHHTQGDGEVALIVRQALAFTEGPLKLCLQHDLTGLLGTPNSPCSPSI